MDVEISSSRLADLTTAERSPAIIDADEAGRDGGTGGAIGHGQPRLNAQSWTISRHVKSSRKSKISRSHNV